MRPRDLPQRNQTDCACAIKLVLSTPTLRYAHALSLLQKSAGNIASEKYSILPSTLMHRLDHDFVTWNDAFCAVGPRTAPFFR